MKPSVLIDQLVQSLEGIKGIDVNLGKPLEFHGQDFDELKIAWDKKEDNVTLHKAGVYIIGTNDEVIYIGEGGPDKNNDISGTMGHRVYQHFDKKDWITEAQLIVLLPIWPRVFSRLGEQLALAIHFQNDKRELPEREKLPKYNKDWK